MKTCSLWASFAFRLACFLRSLDASLELVVPDRKGLLSAVADDRSLLVFDAVPVLWVPLGATLLEVILLDEVTVVSPTLLVDDVPPAVREDDAPTAEVLILDEDLAVDEDEPTGLMVRRELDARDVLCPARSVLVVREEEAACVLSR